MSDDFRLQFQYFVISNDSFLPFYEALFPQQQQKFRGQQEERSSQVFRSLCYEVI